MAIACIPCRKRKCKCDGTKPTCVQCNLRVSKCSYESTGDKRKRSHKEFEDLTKRLNAHREIINIIAEGGPKGQAVVSKLQKDPNFVKTLANDESTFEAADNIDIEGNLLRTDNHGKISFYGETSNVPMIVDSELIVNSKTSPTNTLGNITPKTTEISEEVVLELLSLYFCWQHTYYNILDKGLFLSDMQTQGPFYSEFLLNAILTHACHLSDRHELRSDPDDAATAGDQFYKRAMELLPKELDNASITAVQGLLLLASKESGIGKSSLGWTHSGMAFRIAIDLGLHLDSTKLKNNGHITEQEHSVRNSTFWGCYIFDQGWSFYLGRPPAIHESDITLAFPKYEEEIPVEWTPFYEQDVNTDANIRIEFYPRNTLTAIIYIYSILHDIIFSVYSSKKDKKRNYSKSLEYCHEQLLNWSKELPVHLKRVDGVMHPAVIMLHTMYHSAIIFLYRPFFKLSGKGWEYANTPDPLTTSKESAISIINLMSKYKGLYTYRKIVNLAAYVTSTASTVFLAISSFEDTYESPEQASCQEILLELGASWPDASIIYQRISHRILEATQRNSNDLYEGTEEGFQWGANQVFELDDFMLGSDIYFD